jgi:hypothetical protein
MRFGEKVEGVSILKVMAFCSETSSLFQRGILFLQSIFVQWWRC